MEQYAAIVESSQDAIYVKSPEGVITNWNRGAEHMYGYSADEIIGKPITLIVPEERKEEVLNVLAKISRGETAELVETDRVRKDGRRIMVSLSLSPVRDARGTIIGASAIARDITAQKKAKDEIAALNLSLRHRLAELQAIFDTAPMGIAVAHDPKCCRITLNATGAEVLGLQPDQLLSFDAGDAAVLPFRAFCGGKELKPEELPMQRAAANNVDIRDEIVEHLFADGSRKLVSVNASPLLDEDGRVRGAVATLTDVTERTRIEEEIKRLNESLSSQNAELASANRELEAFSYSVSHDLRAPLRTMASFARFLLEDYADKLDGKGKDLLTRIGKASSKMTRLIDDLLSVSRISRQEVKRTDVDMSALTASIIGGLREAAPGRTVDVSIQEGLRASADATLIEVVLSNLIGNAWKFTSKTENAKLEFGSVQSEEKVTYYVRDNGAGFDTGHMNDMFQPFRRLHSENEFEGTGIGLTIVERIIHSHGGKIWAEAEVGKGATLYFTLE
ncbi:MAG: PAS domain S-box protein [Candidatus Sulfobium sp.]